MALETVIPALSSSAEDLGATRSLLVPSSGEERNGGCRYCSILRPELELDGLKAFCCLAIEVHHGALFLRQAPCSC